MTTTAEYTETTSTETVRNGVNTATMFATLDAIKAQPEIAQFRFRATNRWLGSATIGRRSRLPLLFWRAVGTTRRRHRLPSSPSTGAWIHAQLRRNPVAQTTLVTPAGTRSSSRGPSSTGSGSRGPRPARRARSPRRGRPRLRGTARRCARRPRASPPVRHRNAPARP